MTRTSRLFVGPAPRITSVAPGISTYLVRDTPSSTHYLGLHQVVRPDGLYSSQQCFGMYRWHGT